ncbi:MAG: hypothetical protein KDA42_06300 [Planctomycetales bacterium]|nr:hypothetical protein [Planctomycetales bacterium]
MKSRWYNTLLVVAVLLVAAAFPMRADEAAPLPSIFPSSEVQRLPALAADEMTERLPTIAARFPELPPPPNETDDIDLPPLEEELATRGSYLYDFEGSPPPVGYLNDTTYSKHLRLPEDFSTPRPLTLFQDFLGADPIRTYPNLHWPGCEGFAWEPRFVGYGQYSLFGFAFEEGGESQGGIGHHLIADFDLRLTGTERAHVQFRPLGRENTGGSFYQLSEPTGYIDNSTGIPDRYWVEGELYSIIQGLTGQEFTPRDYHFVVGRFPFQLHNRLLMNDDIVGVAINKNTVYVGDLSNLNIQAFYAFDDVDAYTASSDLYGIHSTAEYRLMLMEATYARVAPSHSDLPDRDYAAFSLTRYFGPCAVSGRDMGKWESSSADGQLFVLESNYTRHMHGHLAHMAHWETAVFYANAFYATPDWRPISGGNFDRLRSAFEVSPLVAIARGTADNTTGVALGVQLFGSNEDSSLTPEIAFEAPGGTGVLGIGLRYQRKTGKRSFFDIQAIGNWSDDESLERAGVFASETILF